jgi:hypothetical protein
VPVLLRSVCHQPCRRLLALRGGATTAEVLKFCVARVTRASAKTVLLQDYCQPKRGPATLGERTSVGARYVCLAIKACICQAAPSTAGQHAEYLKWKESWSNGLAKAKFRLVAIIDDHSNQQKSRVCSFTDFDSLDRASSWLDEVHKEAASKEVPGDGPKIIHVLVIGWETMDEPQRVTSWANSRVRKPRLSSSRSRGESITQGPANVCAVSRLCHAPLWTTP